MAASTVEASAMATLRDDAPVAGSKTG